MMSSGLIIPAMVLALMGWLVPKLLSLCLPEGVRPLMLNALISTICMFILSALVFVGLYIWDGVAISNLFEPSLLVGHVTFFGHLGLVSAIIWLPIMIVSLANLPRSWVVETW